MISAFGNFVDRRSVHASSEAVERPMIDALAVVQKQRHRAEGREKLLRMTIGALAFAKVPAIFGSQTEQLVPQLLSPDFGLSLAFC